MMLKNDAQLICLGLFYKNISTGYYHVRKKTTKKWNLIKRKDTQKVYLKLSEKYD